jgi:hypothetical protein
MYDKQDFENLQVYVIFLNSFSKWNINYFNELLKSFQSQISIKFMVPFHLEHFNSHGADDME